MLTKSAQKLNDCMRVDNDVGARKPALPFVYWNAGILRGERYLGYLRVTYQPYAMAYRHGLLQYAFKDRGLRAQGLAM